MADGTSLLHHLLIEKAVLTKCGQAFEDFFSECGLALWGADFEPWKPQGRFGDLKCDGYLVSEKTVFQCHAPETPSPDGLERKIEDAFFGAKDHFGEEMKKWCFVHNVRQGLPAMSGGNFLIQLRKDNPKVAIEAWHPEVLIQHLSEAPETLSRLFPTLLDGVSFNVATDAAMEKYIQELRVERSIERQPPQIGDNRVKLAQFFEDLADQDEDIRTRLMGFAMWFEPASKAKAIGYLSERGHEVGSVQSNIDRLLEAGVIAATRDHLLPRDKELCQEAAESLIDEFIEMLEQG